MTDIQLLLLAYALHDSKIVIGRLEQVMALLRPSCAVDYVRHHERPSTTPKWEEALSEQRFSA